MSETKELSFFEGVSYSTDKASKFLNMDQGLLEQIRACNLVLRLRFPVKDNEGKVRSTKPIEFNTAIIECLPKVGFAIVLI